jgi:lipoprotein-anchoring transpeptidase ErfK/SrfK
MRRRLVPLIALLVSLVVAAPAAAQDTPPPVVAPAGSTIAGIDVSGQDAATALATMNAAFGQPIVIGIGERVFKVWGAQLDATYDLQPAVDEATTRTAAGNTPVTVDYSETKLQKVADRVIRMASAKGQEARWEFKRTRPVLRLGKPGSAPNRKAVVEQIRRALSLPALRAQQDVIPLAPVETEATLAKLGYVVVISKPSRVLSLYAPVKGKAKIVRTYRVAVGAPSFPTPTGRFTIVDKQVNPWWYPPSSDWAKGEEPVPPGPGNPLGTRWMGLDREDVGIHGTPDSGSIGGYASHGCVRMLIRQAEALYSLVDVGTPVIIY